MEYNHMAAKKKNKLTLVKVNDLSDDQLDEAIDKALDALFGESEDQKPARETGPAARKKPARKPKPTKSNVRD
jgi:hypothetical protein